MLLTPHWRASDPLVDPANFQELFNRGIYNAGFIAANKEAVPILEWWGKLCEYKCDFAPQLGFHADQTYLNLFPIYFSGVEILKHKGCNVANWNIVECKRVVSLDGTVLICNEFPIVFIHFTRSTINGILRGSDRILMPYLKQYSLILKKYSGRDIFDEYTLLLPKKKPIPSPLRFLYAFRKKIKILLSSSRNSLRLSNDKYKG